MSALLALLAAGTGAVCKKRRSKGAVWLPVFLLFVLLGMGRAGDTKQKWEARERACMEMAGIYSELHGRVSAVEEAEGKVQIKLEENVVRPLAGGGEGRSFSMSRQIPCVLVSWKTDGAEYMPDARDFKIGSYVTVRGKLELFARARNPGEFDSRSYYRGQGVDCRMYGEDVEISGGDVSPLPELLRQIREKAKQNIMRSAAAEDAGIFSAAVLGDKKALDSQIKDLYQKNGIAHLLAISGLHLSIIGMGGYKLLRKAGLGYKGAGLAGAAFIFCYGAMTGGSPSVVRAVVMMITGFLASYLGRTYDLLSALSLALLMLVWETPELLTQGGVQLSFGAVFAVGGVLPVIQDYLGKERKILGALMVSAAIQLVTLPVILWDFFQFPVYGIFLNLLVIPLMGGVICSGIGTALLGGISCKAGALAAGTGHYILQFYEWLCHGTERLPYHTLVMGRPAAAAVILYYMVLLVALIGMKRAVGKRAEAEKSRPIWLRTVLFFCICVFLPCILMPRPVDGMEILFLDVGQGDGILIRSGRGAMLIDGGSTSEKKLGEYRLEPCLKSCGVSVIEYAFVSHGDLDHISGVRYLLESCEEIEIRNLLLPCQGREDDALLSLAELARARGTKVSLIEAGDSFYMEGIGVTCLYPGISDLPADKNEESEVLKVDYGNCHILFTGDMSGEGELRLLSALSEKTGVLSEIQILKTAHHGSRFSSEETFLDALGVKWAVISYAEGNSYGHPHKEVLERLGDRSVKIYGTAERGAITMKTDGKMVRWKAFLD
ncbi:DNA internalization-related competence protein ComEC/Rec2 [Hungatella sp. L12]|uniref:DNA internalization-related competence protein ComEC/Rec2 n=1 Tax=Hungatella hominis TaxID=2763050 RepID=A0ABR7HAV7_9FIRM|nr:DNA internalization-related competence protein ComEC/Rec2 [Hungatella hominis]